MKKITFIYLLALCAGSLMICSYAGGPATHNIEGTGAETGLGNVAGCGQGCHALGTTTTIALELDSAGIPTTRYVAGMTYTVKLTGKNTSTTSLPRFGFQIGSIVGSSAVTTPVNAGTWKAPYPANTKYIAPKAGKFVVGVIEQTAAIPATSGTGGNGTTYVETFNWTAPAAGTGTISFWANLNAVNNNGSDKGDKYNTGHVAITEMVASSLKATASAVNVKCNGSKTGSAAATATGGAPPYTYSWNSTPMQTTATATGLAAGSYTVTIKDAQGATTTAIAKITEPIAITVSATSTNVTCNGGTNGSAIVTATGGSGTLMYSWNSNPVQTTTMATNLSGGTYTVTVTDASNCFAKSAVAITQPAQLVITTTPTNASSCTASDGSITTSVSGGTPSYTYAWNNSKTASSITGLATGTYSLTVTDANNCKQSTTADVSCGSANLSVTINKTDVKCFGGNDGSATAVASGTPPYTYSWSTIPVQTNATASALKAGTYTVTVKDANNSTKSVSVKINSATAVLSVLTAANTSSCASNDGSITTNVSGGTPPYSYSWNNGSTSTAITDLAMGTYTLTVTDANGCKKMSTSVVNFSGAISLLTPLKEGFEGSTDLPRGWTLDNQDGDAAWQVVTNVAHTGTNAIGFDNCDGNGAGTDMTGTSDRFMTVPYDFTNATTAASLTFDLAYAVLKYKNQTLSDTLAVYSSTDCGTTWNQLYYKGGADLSAITTSESCWMPTNADWKTESIDLSMLAGKGSVMFAFENRSNWGEWIYIDNINITAVTGVEEINPLVAFSIYPNPASTEFTLEGTNNAIEKIHYSVYTVLGLEVKSGDVQTNGGFFNEKLQVNNFSGGMYFIKLSDKKNTWTKKLIIE